MPSYRAGDTQAARGTLAPRLTLWYCPRRGHALKRIRGACRASDAVGVTSTWAPAADHTPETNAGMEDDAVVSHRLAHARTIVSQTSPMPGCMGLRSAGDGMGE